VTIVARLSTHFFQWNKICRIVNTFLALSKEGQEPSSTNRLIAFVTIEPSIQEHTMTRKTLQFFQLFLEVFAVFTILKGQLFIALLCLVIIFLIGRYATISRTSDKEEVPEAKTSQNEIDIDNPVFY